MGFLLFTVVVAFVMLERTGNIDEKMSSSYLKISEELKGSIIVIGEQVPIAKGRIADAYRTASNLKFAGRYDETVGHCRNMVKENPNHRKSKYNICSCLLYSGNVEDAAPRDPPWQPRTSDCRCPVSGQNRHGIRARGGAPPSSGKPSGSAPPRHGTGPSGPTRRRRSRHRHPRRRCEVPGSCRKGHSCRRAPARSRNASAGTRNPSTSP